MISPAAHLTVVDVVASVGTGRGEVLRLAAAVERPSDHPVARALVEAAGRERAAAATERDDPTSPRPADVGADGVPVGADQVLDRRASEHGASGVVRTAHSGLGLGTRVLVGRPAWLAGEGVVVGSDLAAAFRAAEDAGATAVMAAWNGTARGVVVLREADGPTDRPVLSPGDGTAPPTAPVRPAGGDQRKRRPSSRR